MRARERLKLRFASTAYMEWAVVTTTPDAPRADSAQDLES